MTFSRLDVNQKEYQISYQNVPVVQSFHKFKLTVNQHWLKKCRFSNCWLKAQCFIQNKTDRTSQVSLNTTLCLSSPSSKEKSKQLTSIALSWYIIRKEVYGY